MPTSAFDPTVQAAIDDARSGRVAVTASPEDWRDAPIYFLMVDRFTNNASLPRNLPYDASFGSFQGGTFAGVTAKLGYIRAMGFGAVWLSPVLKNPQFDQGAYHGYGIQNFLAVEPRFASAPGQEEAELRALIDEAHRLGLYVILDIVLHHAGDVFEYAFPNGQGGVAEMASVDWQGGVAPIRWRDASGTGDPAASDAPAAPPLDAAVWPSELRQNALFTRRGNANSNGFHPAGDFDSLKGISFDPPQAGTHSAADVLIRTYSYVIAKFDVDAFRIDTLKYIPAEVERTFGNAMREFALSIGKKNFFTFGEVYDNEQEIAQFIGRDATATGEVVGVDAALDYPLFFDLPPMLKGLGPTPADVAQVFENRKRVEADVLTSHGEAGQFFVTFLDNHDQPQRFGYTGPTQLQDQIALGLAVLFALPGIPCVYYGTEQGLSGHKTPAQQDDSMVREALWGKPNGFDTTHPLYLAMKGIGGLRAQQPALRYGRYYFRPISGDGANYGLCTYPTGVLAFSRILNDQEVVVVANTDAATFAGTVIVDGAINGSNPTYRLLYSNKGTGGTAIVLAKPQGVTVHEVDGSTTNGPLRVLPVSLRPGEVQILAI